MGISGLLQILKSITRDKKLSDFQNTRVAVDTYVWLHKGIYKCANELASGKESEEYIGFTLKKVEMLLHNKITPVMVFDGGKLPSKLKTEQNRDRNRKEAYEKALELQKNGLHDKARAKFAESVDVTPYMAYKLIKVLKTKYNLECIVAPYEADAQLAYLSKINYVDFIITEDADLLAYGAKRVLFKLDADGAGKEILYNDIYKCQDLGINQFDENMFLSACIMSGCDYVSSISKIGPKTAFKLIKEHKNILNILKYIRFEGKISIPPGYIEDFERAMLTFKFQRVYCPIKRKIVTVNSISFEYIKSRISDLEFLESVLRELSIDSHVLNRGLGEVDLDYLGKYIDEELSQKIANGEADPLTYESFHDMELGELKKNLRSKSTLRADLPTTENTWGSFNLIRENKMVDESHLRGAKQVSNKSSAPQGNFIGFHRQKESRFKITPREDKPVEKQLSIFSYFHDPKQSEAIKRSQEALHSQEFSLDPSPQFGLKRRSISLNKGLISNQVDNTELLFRNSISVKKPFKMPSTKSTDCSNEVLNTKDVDKSIESIYLRSKQEEITEVNDDLQDFETFDALETGREDNEFVVGRAKYCRMQIERDAEPAMDEEAGGKLEIRKADLSGGIYFPKEKEGKDGFCRDFIHENKDSKMELQSSGKKNKLQFEEKENQSKLLNSGNKGFEPILGSSEGDLIRKKLKNEHGHSIIQRITFENYKSPSLKYPKFLSNFKINQLNLQLLKKEFLNKYDNSPEGIKLINEGEDFMGKCGGLFKGREWNK